MKMSRRFFEDINQTYLYAKSRPKLPNQILNLILTYLSEKVDKKDCKLAVDVGCGSGQCTNAFAHHFETVYGFDVSPAQISAANNSDHPENVYFHISAAESLSTVESNSAQLLTANAAAHFFDLHQFLAEANRVLAPNGVLALIGYNHPQIIDPLNPNNSEINNLILDIVYHQKIINCDKNKLIDTSIKLVKNEYKDIKFPHNFEYVYKNDIAYTDNVNAQQIMDLIKSSGIIQNYREENESEANKLIAEVENKLQTILGVVDLSQKDVSCNYNYFLAFGRKLND